MDQIMKDIQTQLNPTVTEVDFKSGDTITISYKIKEGDKTRIQKFQGVVLQRRGSGATESFTVRKVSQGIGVERIFPLSSPFIESIEINRRGSVRRARLFYLRQRTGKAARIKDKKRISTKETGTK